jgi:hypothetical protein
MPRILPDNASLLDAERRPSEVDRVMVLGAL